MATSGAFRTVGSKDGALGAVWWLQRQFATPRVSPGAISRASTIHPMATVAFSAQILVDPASVDAREPLLHESWISRAAGGYTAETRRLWTSDGRLAVENFQAIAIIR